jgi:prepilin-type N-terminal cleavage/methylation domain-containing protein
MLFSHLYKKKLLSLATINIRVNNKALGRNSGFSLLEFAIVLIIIAILSALLLYKFNIMQDGRYEKSSIQLTANSLQLAVKSTRNLWLTKGGRDRVGNLQELKNQTSVLQGFGNGNVLMSKSGWPVDALILGTESTEDQSSENAQAAVLNNSICTRLWQGLLKNTSPKVKTFSGNNSEPIEAGFIYLAEFNQGVCIYRYLMVDNDWRIEYDLETGYVSTFFE